MLQLLNTRIVISQPEDVLTGVIIPEEGLALSYVKDGVDTKVQLSTGVADEVFAGVSFSRNCPPAFLPIYLDDVIPVGLVYTLPRNPIPGQLLVKIAGAPATLVVGAPSAANEVQVGSLSLNFFAGTAGSVISIQYQYAPTVLEARTVIGDAPIGGLSSTAEGSIGVLKNAIIGTNSFDASVDWSVALFVALEANGVFTVGTLAAHIPNVVIRSAPSAANPFLVLSINVA